LLKLSCVGKRDHTVYSWNMQTAISHSERDGRVMMTQEFCKQAVLTAKQFPSQCKMNDHDQMNNDTVATPQQYLC